MFAAARFLATRAQPYLSAALFAMDARIAEGLESFAVDRWWRVYLDPDRLREWSADESAAVLLHEVGHLVRDHAGRGERLGVTGHDDHFRWNVAGDLAINDDLVADGERLPGRPLLPAELDLPPGLVEEDYYDRLGHQADQRVRPGDANVSAAETDCGSGADGRRRVWELGADDPQMPGLPPAAQAAVRVQVASAVRDQGHAPLGWLRWADEQGPARSDWRRVLRGAITAPRHWRAGGLESSWLRPDRRQDAHEGLVLPGVRSPRFEIAVVVDTSGSMTTSELNAALAEIAAVQRQCGVRQMWVIACDTEPAPPVRVRTAERVQLLGGGGTDLRPALALLSALRPKPDVGVVLTDGWTPWPDRPPRAVPLVVATTDKPCPLAGVRTVCIDVPGA